MAKFQGYARGKGFQSIDPGYDALTRMREKQREELSDLKQAEKDQRQRDLNADEALARVNRNEEANQKEIYLEDQVITAQERALRINRDQAVSNNTANLKRFEQKTADLEKLVNFSSTALDAANAIRKKDWDVTADASYNFYMTHGLSLEDQIRLYLLEYKQWAQGEALEQVADQMKEEGYTPQEVMWVRHRNSASDYGRLKASSVIAGNKFGAWAASKLGEMDAQTVEQKQAALEILSIEYLKAHKLYGLSSDFLGPMFTKMSGARSRIINQAELAEAVASSEKRTREKFEVVVANMTPESVNELFVAFTRQYEEGSFDTYTNAESRDKTLDALLLNIEAFPADKTELLVQLLKETPYGDQNTFWYDANKKQIEEKLAQRAQKLEYKNTTNAYRVKQAKAAELAEVDKYFNPSEEDKKAGKGWNGDFRVVDKIMNDLVKKGHDAQIVQERYGHYLDQSVQTKNDPTFWESHYQTKLNDHRLTLEDFNDPNFSVRSDKSISQLKLEVAENDRKIAASGWKEEHLEDVESILTNVLVSKDLKRGGKKDDSYGPALYRAETIFRGCIIGGKSGNECRDELVEAIEDPTGDFEVGGYGAGSNKPGSFFKNFQSRAETEAKVDSDDFSILNDEEKKEAFNLLEKHPEYVQTKLFIKPEQIKEIAQAINEGRRFEYPPILNEISKSDINLYGSVPELFQKQVEIAEGLGLLTGVKVENLDQAWFRDVNDPNAEHLLKNIQTLSDLRKRIQITGRPDSVRDTTFMDSQTVAALTGNPTSITTEDMKQDDNYKYIIDPNSAGQFVPAGGADG